jgi:ABC-type lipoprotein export system ATPase subunit
MLSIRNLDKSFAGPAGAVAALRGVSLEMSEGQFLAVRGPSGCGKSTLLLACGALLRPDTGQVLLDGRDVYGLSPDQRAWLRAWAIGFVFQRFHLVPYLSALENVLAVTVARPLPQGHDRARNLLERLGMAERMGHYPAQLSTGERQRVALARAMLHRPKLILADEPTGNLDPENGRVVLEALAEFAAAGGAVLLVTHDPAAATRAQGVLFMEKGQLSNSSGCPIAPPDATIAPPS